MDVNRPFIEMARAIAAEDQDNRGRSAEVFEGFNSMDDLHFAAKVLIVIAIAMVVAGLLFLLPIFFSMAMFLMDLVAG